MASTVHDCGDGKGEGDVCGSYDVFGCGRSSDAPLILRKLNNETGPLLRKPEDVVGSRPGGRRRD